MDEQRGKGKFDTMDHCTFEIEHARERPLHECQYEVGRWLCRLLIPESAGIRHDVRPATVSSHRRHKMIFVGIAMLALTFVVSSCAPLLPGSGIIKGPQTYRVQTDIKTGNFRRSYTVHIPPRYHQGDLLPMVVVVHGAFDTAKGMEKYSGFSKLADKEDFIVLYPNGIGIFGLLQHWNAGHCCGKAQADDIDDVGFVADVIKASVRRLKVDPNRIYMVGFSNGGMFVHRFAAEKSDMLAGAAALAASIGSRADGATPVWRISQPAGPVPMLVMHGTADTNVPMEDKGSHRNGAQRVYTPVKGTLEFWAKHNGCSSSPTVETLYAGAVRKTLWGACKSGKPVSFYAIEGWDHRWPGLYFTDKLDELDPLKEYNASEIIWNFFKPFHR